jgi:hypothetical protein
LLEAKNDILERFGNEQNKVDQVFGIIGNRWETKLKTPLHRVGYYLNPYYYYQNKLDIEKDGSFREGFITCITKLVDNVDVQDQTILELERYQNADGSIGREIAKRQWRNKKIDPGK